MEGKNSDLVNKVRSQFPMALAPLIALSFFNQQNKGKRLPLSLEILTRHWDSFSLSGLFELKSRGGNYMSIQESLRQPGSTWPGEHPLLRKRVQRSPLSAKCT